MAEEDRIVWPDERSLLWWLVIAAANAPNALNRALKPGRHEFAVTIPEDEKEPAEFEFTTDVIYMPLYPAQPITLDGLESGHIDGRKVEDL